MKMKHLKILAFTSVLLTSVISWAQKDVQGIAYYSSSREIDASAFGEDEDPERIKRRIERMREIFDNTFILTFNQVESFYKEVEKESSGGGGWRGMINSFTPGPQYKNVKDGKLVQDQEFFGKQFLIIDDLPKHNWVMGSETKKIGDYMCFKATAKRDIPNVGPGSFRRAQEQAEEGEEAPATREVEIEAWYSLQIPVNQGPEDYWGLPGLILEITVDNKTLYCSKIVMNPEEKVEIEIPSDGKEITKADYEALVKKKTDEMRMQFRSREGQRRF